MPLCILEGRLIIDNSTDDPPVTILASDSCTAAKFRVWLILGLSEQCPISLKSPTVCSQNDDHLKYSTNFPALVTHPRNKRLQFHFVPLVIAHVFHRSEQSLLFCPICVCAYLHAVVVPNRNDSHHSADKNVHIT
jgi:hypothetical protein